MGRNGRGGHLRNASTQLGQNQASAGGMATASAEQTAQAAALLQQAFVAMQASTVAGANTSTGQVEQVDPLSKAIPSADKPESSAQGAMKGSGKPPYCYRCYTKGHKMDDCTAELYYEICVVMSTPCYGAPSTVRYSPTQRKLLPSLCHAAMLLKVLAFTISTHLKISRSRWSPRQQ